VRQGKKRFSSFYNLFFSSFFYCFLVKKSHFKKEKVNYLISVLANEFLYISTHSPRDGAVFVLRAVVGSVGVDAPPEEGPAAVAGDGAVVDVVVGNVAAALTAHLPDKLGPLARFLLLTSVAAAATAAAAAAGRARHRVVVHF
jgi:hypothetical protein